MFSNYKTVKQQIIKSDTAYTGLNFFKKQASHIEVKCFRSISEIDEHLWNGIDEGKDIFHSHKFLTCIEKSGIENSRLWYLIFYNKQRTVGTAVLSLFQVSLDLLSGRVVEQLCNYIRKYVPGFLKIKLLFCGTPISIGKNNLKISDKTFIEEILNSLVNKMTELAKENRVNIVCLKEFDEEECKSLSRLSAKGFIKALSIPYVNLYFDRQWYSFNDYLISMRSNYRRQINKSLKKISLKENYSSLSMPPGQNLTKFIIKIPTMSDASAFHKLYLEVMKNARNKMEILNKNFFENIFNDMNNHCRMISLVKEEKILGSALIFRQKDTMTFLLIGMDYEENKIYDTYFNIVYKIISFAIEERCKLLEMGQTSYYLKLRCGGNCEDRYFFIKCLNRPLHYLLSVFKSQLFPETDINKLQVFKSKLVGSIEKNQKSRKQYKIRQ